MLFVDIITLIDTGDLFLGGNRQLFLCNPPNRMILNGTLEGITYTMIMDMSNTEIQAFNIKDGILSSNSKVFWFKDIFVKFKALRVPPLVIFHHGPKLCFLSVFMKLRVRQLLYLILHILIWKVYRYIVVYLLLFVILQVRAESAYVLQHV